MTSTVTGRRLGDGPRAPRVRHLQCHVECPAVATASSTRTWRRGSARSRCRSVDVHRGRAQRAGQPAPRRGPTAARRPRAPRRSGPAGHGTRRLGCRRVPAVRRPSSSSPVTRRSTSADRQAQPLRRRPRPGRAQRHAVVGSGRRPWPRTSAVDPQRPGRQRARRRRYGGLGRGVRVGEARSARRRAVRPAARRAAPPQHRAGRRLGDPRAVRADRPGAAVCRGRADAVPPASTRSAVIAPACRIPGARSGNRT